MTKVTLDSIVSGYSSSTKLNNNFETIEEAFDNTLSLDGSAPNSMLADLDMNSQRILNLPSATTSTEPVTYAQFSSALADLSAQGWLIEEQTATAAQTVFTLTQVTYTPGTGNLGVYINGVRQHPSVYSETSSSVVTLSSPGAQVGDKVLFEVLVLDESTESLPSNLVTHISAGTGAVATTVREKLRERVSVKDFGAVGDGVADDTTAITAGVTYLATAGGGVLYFPRGSYKLTSTLGVTDDNITLEGDGGIADGNVAFIGGISAAISAAATRIFWAGSSGGTLVLMRPAPDDGTKAPLNGGGIRNLCLDGAGSAADVLDIRSLRNSVFENLLIARGTSVNLKVGVNNTMTVGNNKSLAFCQFRNVQVTNSTLATTAKTMVCYGHITDGNVAINKWDNCGFYNETGSGSHIEMENCDSNTFIHCRWNGSLTLHATDTGSFSTSSAVARHNGFFNCQGHIVAKAKIATPHVQGTNGYDSYGNFAFGYNRDNSIAYPTIEAYADFTFEASSLGLTNFEGAVKMGGAANICLMAKTANQSIPNNTTTAVDWDAVSYDWFSAGNATTNRITAPNGVKWCRISYGAEWASDSTTGRFIGIRKNGSTLISKDQRAGYLSSQATITTQVFAVTPGDYFEMVVNQNTGGALNLLGTTSTFMQAEWH